MELVTVRTFEFPTEADVLKSKLESEGVECFLKDELTTQVNPLYSGAIGGVKLQVWENDLAITKAIIGELEQEKLTDDQGNVIFCPICQSEDIISGY